MSDDAAGYFDDDDVWHASPRAAVQVPPKQGEGGYFDEDDVWQEEHSESKDRRADVSKTS